MEVMTLNQVILDQIAKINAAAKDKGYEWDSSGKTHGSFGDVLWDGQVILKGAENLKTYCCGVNLQGYLMSCDEIGKMLGTAADVRGIQRDWYMVVPKKGIPIYENKGPVDALVPRGLGREVSWDDAEPGDQCQLWRKSGSGHNVTLINKFTDKGIKAVKYWSSQPSTNGPGYKTEYFDGVKNPITHLWICRPI